MTKKLLPMDLILKAKLHLSGVSFIDYYIVQNSIISESTEIKTLATDCIKNIYYNADFVNTIVYEDSDNENSGILSLSTVLAHESRHTIGKHALTGRFNNRYISNVAQDFIVNKTLYDDGLWYMNHKTFSIDDFISFIFASDEEKKEFTDRKALLDTNIDLKEVNSEYLYNLLIERFKDEYNKRNNEANKSSGGEDDSSSAITSSQAENMLGDIVSGDYNKIGSYMFGDDVELDGEVKSDADYNSIDEELERKIRDAFSEAKSRGHKTGSLQHLYKERKRGKIPWNRELRSYIRNNICKDEVTFKRISRKMMTRHNLVYPSKYSNKIDTIYLCLDTSGSMFNVLDKCVDEIYSIYNSVKAKNLIIDQIDTKIVDSKKLSSGDKLPKHFLVKGLGRTSFYPPFNKVVKENMNPDIMIYLTDGEYDFPPKPKINKKVIWVIYDNPNTIAPFGKTIHIDRGELVGKL